MKVRYFGNDYDCKLLRVMRSRVRVRFAYDQGSGKIEKTVDVSIDRLKISLVDRYRLFDRDEVLLGTGANVSNEDWIYLIALAKAAGVWPDPPNETTVADFGIEGGEDIEV